MARGWIRFDGPTLLVLSGHDLTAREFTERLRSDSALAEAASRDGVTTQSLDDADHTLSSAAASNAHLKRLITWLRDAWADIEPSPERGQATGSSNNGELACRR
jgi:hypothetical protein